MRYRFRLLVGDVSVGRLGELAEILRGLATVKPVPDTAGLPIALDVIYTIGPDGAAPDLWDLRDLIDEVNETISDYTGQRLGKPTLMADPDALAAAREAIAYMREHDCDFLTVENVITYGQGRVDEPAAREALAEAGFPPA